jgi:hypothetical protein
VFVTFVANRTVSCGQFGFLNTYRTGRSTGVAELLSAPL